MSARTYEFGADSRLFADEESQMRERGIRFTDDRGSDDSGMIDGRTIGGRFYSVGDGGRVTGEREYAVNSYPSTPGGGPQITVDTALQQPNIISRALTDLAWQRFIADKIFMRGTPDQIRGGAAVFERAESLFPDRTAETRQHRAGWKRSAWTVPDLFASPVQQFGLETPIADTARRRNALDVLARAQVKLSNAVVKAIDAAAVLLITTDAAVNQFTASTTWSSGSPTIVADLAACRNAVNNADLGYEVDTLIINPAQETAMITSTALQALLPRESTPRNAAMTGLVVPIMGLKQILVTNQMPAGKGIMLASNIVGSIADEPPLADEGYTSYNPGGAQAPVQVKKYRDEDTDESILRAARFAAMWIAEPKAAVYMQGL